MFGAVWQTGRLVYTRNIIELVQNPDPTGNRAGFAVGNSLAVTQYYIFREVFIRQNRVRPVDDVFDGRSAGLGANWVENGIVENNIFSALLPDAMGYHNFGSFRHFNNQTAAGQLVQAALYSSSPPGSPVYLQSLNQTETEIDLALTSSVAT